MSSKLNLKTICPTHGNESIPLKCQKLVQQYHSGCGGYQQICLNDGKLHCRSCGYTDHISNFSFFCPSENKSKKFTYLSGDVSKNLCNMLIGSIDDYDEQENARRVFKAIWKR